MSRMRLMEAPGAGAGALAWVCLYCGAESESKPPYEVLYCNCRSEAVGGRAASDPTRRPSHSLRRAA